MPPQESTRSNKEKAKCKTAALFNVYHGGDTEVPCSTDVDNLDDYTFTASYPWDNRCTASSSGMLFFPFVANHGSQKHAEAGESQPPASSGILHKINSISARLRGQRQERETDSAQQDGEQDTLTCDDFRISTWSVVAHEFLAANVLNSASHALRCTMVRDNEDKSKLNVDQVMSTYSNAHDITWSDRFTLLGLHKTDGSPRCFQAQIGLCTNAMVSCCLPANDRGHSKGNCPSQNWTKTGPLVRGASLVIGFEESVREWLQETSEQDLYRTMTSEFTFETWEGQAVKSAVFPGNQGAGKDDIVVPDTDEFFACAQRFIRLRIDDQLYIDQRWRLA